MFSLYIYCHQVYFIIYDFVVYIYRGLVYFTSDSTTRGNTYYGSLDPETGKIHYSVTMPYLQAIQTHIILVHQINEMMLIRVNTIAVPGNVRYSQIPKCFLSIILTMNGSSFEIDLGSSFYTKDNEILSSIFLMHYMHKHHSAAKFDFSYTLECMDNNLTIIELTQNKYVRLDWDYQYSIITIQS